MLVGLDYKNANNGREFGPAKANTYLRIAFEGGEVRAAAMLAQLLSSIAERDDGSLAERIAAAAMFWAGLSAEIDGSPEIRARSKFIHDELARLAPDLAVVIDAKVANWISRNPDYGDG